MSKKKLSKASTRRIFTIGVVAICFIVYFLFTAFEYLININKLTTEEHRLKENLSSLMEEENGLKNEIVKLNNPDYIAKYARENYQYSRNGEYIIQISPSESVEIETNGQKWDIKIVASITFSSVLFILFLKRITR